MEYEFIFLLNDEEELKKIKDLIKSSSGKLLEESSLGEKTLTYPIKKNRAAHFYEWKFRIDPSKLTQIKQKLNYNDKLIRYLLLRSGK